MAGEDWTDRENDLIIADYFAMLTGDLAAQTHSKAEHNPYLARRNYRGCGSIDLKHQNISAVLKGLADPVENALRAGQIRRARRTSSDAALRRPWKRGRVVRDR